ncbi:Facilitated trehalose transporter Tret1 [Eumeta japonica]|uniref:Facilitated trehalose transporter Tret1 n=1 Tax=Eumeta variegata TaxID=151549 RepID=A0A4C1SS39_EUMVA|nr:Facilitated trehalose transporter Tret1 [Eumeta japonica]
MYSADASAILKLEICPFFGYKTTFVSSPTFTGSMTCFVTAGASLNSMGYGLIVSFSSILLPQLKQENSLIPIDDATGSWIASIIGFSFSAGAFILPSLMNRYGRKVANLVSIMPMIIGWFCIVTATSVPALFVARILQGISAGMSSCLAPILIGEYTSPKNRGAFLTTISLAIASGVLVVHTAGVFLSWQQTALVCAFISFIDLLIVMHSPETPCWLADKGKYNESKRVFRWLRGDDEEEELHIMIETSIIVRELRLNSMKPTSLFDQFKRSVNYVNATLRKKEFYKPVILMFFLNLIGQWSGPNVISSYTYDIFHQIVGHSVSVPVLIITVDVQRIISNTCAVYFIKKLKRRTMLFATVSLNIVMFLLIALYVYAKAHNLLPFDHPAIGILMIHLHMFSIATGTLPLPFIVSGEVYPLEYRGIAGGITVLYQSVNLFVTVKTVPYLFASVGLWGAYVLYAGVVGLCLAMTGLLLPETKDRTLQDIEDEFRGRPLSPEEVKSIESLASLRLYSLDRRCSTPALF